MANIATTIYRISCSEENMRMLEGTIEDGMTFIEVLHLIGGFKNVLVTEDMAKKKRLWDDRSPEGGTSHNGETLDEFMEETNIPYGTDLNTVNIALRECGIFPVEFENLSLRGSIDYIESDNDGLWIQFICSTAWDECQDFINAVIRTFKDDEDFSIFWQCEEPGCDYFRTNVEGALYGEYISEFYGGTEFHQTEEDLGKELTSVLLQYYPKDDIPTQWENLGHMHDWCRKYNNEHPDDDQMYIHQFEVV